MQVRSPGGAASDGEYRDGRKRVLPKAACDAIMLSHDMAGATPASSEAEAARCPPIEAIPGCRAAKVRSYQAVSFITLDTGQDESQGDRDRLHLYDRDGFGGAGGRGRRGGANPEYLDVRKGVFPKAGCKSHLRPLAVERKRASPASSDEGAGIAPVAAIARRRFMAKIRSYQAVSLGARDTVQHET